jgi:hypothetical protein
MAMERFLNFLISHNTTIIEVLFGLTLLIVSFLAFRYFLFGGSDGDTTGLPADFSKLEVTLKEIIERAGTVSAPANSSEEAQKLSAEIGQLRVELETKKKEMDELKSKGGETPSAVGLSSEEKSALEAKLKELEAKLAEYEIISEDIADLSFYKEQNIKLQKELEGLKTGGAKPAASTPAPQASPATSAPTTEVPAGSAGAPSAAPAARPEPIIQEPKVRAGEAEQPVEAAKPEPVQPAPPEEKKVEETASIDDDLMAEFAAAVAKQKGEPESATPPSEAAASSAAVETPPAETAVDPAASEAVVDLGQVDMDKMLAESAEIQSSAAKDLSVEEALGTSMDENKLLQEAAAMNSVSNEDKKLMGDFENFVKKGES